MISHVRVSGLLNAWQKINARQINALQKINASFNMGAVAFSFAEFYWLERVVEDRKTLQVNVD